MNRINPVRLCFVLKSNFPVLSVRFGSRFPQTEPLKFRFRVPLAIFSAFLFESVVCWTRSLSAGLGFIVLSSRARSFSLSGSFLSLRPFIRRSSSFSDFRSVFALGISADLGSLVSVWWICLGYYELYFVLGFQHSLFLSGNICIWKFICLAFLYKVWGHIHLDS